jgi:hypothetical protein
MRRSVTRIAARDVRTGGQRAYARNANEFTCGRWLVVRDRTDAERIIGESATYHCACARRASHV